MRELDLQKRVRRFIRKAKSIKIYQSGITQSGWGDEILRPNVEISSESTFTQQYDSGEPIRIEFQHPSKGGGKTCIIMLIPENTFGTICEVMFEASPNAARQAFLSLLTKEAKFLDRRKKEKSHQEKSEVS